MKTTLITAILLALTFGVVPAEAYVTESLSDIEVLGDFMVSPAKVERTVAPGTSEVVEILVTNRTGERRRFTLEVEDAQGSSDPETPIVLLGDDQGPYSVKAYLSFAESAFELEHGERARIPVTITVPADAIPGGRYGSVLVANAKVSPDGGSGAVVRSRVGTLFFVTVPGEVVKDGSLAGFGTMPQDASIFFKNPIRFQMLFENKSSVHLTPFGAITIKNIFGSVVGTVPVDPWYAMPNSVRRREITLEEPLLFGYYTAEAAIDRSYGDVVDTKTTSFVVVSWLGLAVLVLVLLALAYLGMRLYRRVRPHTYI